MDLTSRETMLIVEALQRLDPDTLNEDWWHGDERTSAAELDALASKVGGTA